MPVESDRAARTQARLEAAHAAGLLADDELFALEDICCDYVLLRHAASADGAEAISTAAVLARDTESARHL
jgi:hypothetical protein